MLKYTKNFIKVSLFILVLLLLDQGTKFFLYDKGFFEGFYFFTTVFNKGISWGITLDMIIIYAVSFISLLIFWYFYYINYISRSVFILLFAGAVGNLIDRVFLGGVRDFLDIKILPVFNLADVYLTLGVIWLLYNEFFSK